MKALSENSQTKQACRLSPNREPPPPPSAWLELYNEAGFKKPQLSVELTLQQLLHFQIVRQIKHRNACGSQS